MCACVGTMSSSNSEKHPIIFNMKTNMSRVYNTIDARGGTTPPAGLIRATFFSFFLWTTNHTLRATVAHIVYAAFIQYNIVYTSDKLTFLVKLLLLIIRFIQHTHHTITTRALFSVLAHSHTKKTHSFRASDEANVQK